MKNLQVRAEVLDCFRFHRSRRDATCSSSLSNKLSVKLQTHHTLTNEKYHNHKKWHLTKGLILKKAALQDFTGSYNPTPSSNEIKQYFSSDKSPRTCPQALTRKSQVLHLNSWHASTKFPRGLDLGYRSSINAYRCYLHKRVFVNPLIPKSKLVLVPTSWVIDVRTDSLLL